MILEPTQVFSAPSLPPLRVAATAQSQMLSVATRGAHARPAVSVNDDRDHLRPIGSQRAGQWGLVMFELTVRTAAMWSGPATRSSEIAYS
jgi:hypothetical protein